MLRYDIHMHSKYSKDGVHEVRDIIKIAMKRGLHGIAVTDHNTIRGGMEAMKLAPRDLEVICGCEFSTDRGDVIGLFINEEIRETDHMEVIDRIHSQGGVAIVPHPFDSMRGSAFWLNEEDARKIDAVEVINARCMFRRSNATADSYADTHSIGKVGGSDAHFGAEIGNAGTLVPEGMSLRDAILKKQTIAFGNTSSPIFHVRTTALLVKRHFYRPRLVS